MKVSFYAPMKSPTHPVPSGDRRMARLLMQALECGGHDVHLACSLRSWDHGDAQRQHRLEELGKKAAALLLKRYERSPPDAFFTYHLYHKAPDHIGPIVAKALKIPYYVAEASFAPKQKGGKWARGHDLVGQTLAQAAKVFCLSDDDIPCLRPLVGGRIVKISPFLDLTPYKLVKPMRDQLACKLGRPFDEPWMISVAMMRQGDKLDSYRLLAQSLMPLINQPWRLLILGDGPAMEDVQALFAPFKNKVHIMQVTGPDAVIPYLKSCDFFVWPAINEAYGMALLEAQAAGLPVVAGHSPGVAGIVEDEVTGSLPPQGDGIAFTSALERMLCTMELRQHMSAAALEKTSLRHSLEIAARKISEALEK